MELDQHEYATALALARQDAGLELSQADLELTTAFQTKTAIGGAFAGTGSSALRRSNKLQRQSTAQAKAASPAAKSGPKGGPEDQKHPHGGDGKFIQSGDAGKGVKAVQNILGAKTDGEFGTNTTSRVREFQENHGLEVDGVVGQQTAAALLGNKEAKDVAPGALRPGQFKRLVTKA